MFLGCRYIYFFSILFLGLIMNCRPGDPLEDPPDGRVEFSGLQISAINFLPNPRIINWTQSLTSAGKRSFPFNNYLLSVPRRNVCFVSLKFPSRDDCSIFHSCSIFSICNVMIAVFSPAAVWLLHLHCDDCKQSQCLYWSIFSFCSVLIGVFSASAVSWLQYFQHLQCLDCSIFSICSAMIAGFFRLCSSVLIAVVRCGKKAIEAAGNDGELALLLLNHLWRFCPDSDCRPTITVFQLRQKTLY